MEFTKGELEIIQEFKENAFKCVMREIKWATPNGNKRNLDDAFDQYGFTGPYAFLRTYYEDNSYDMLEAIYLLWDEVD